VSALLLASSALVAGAERGVRRSGDCRLLWAALPCAGLAFAVNLVSHGAAPPAETAYGAIVHALLFVDGFFLAVQLALALFALARWHAGRMDRVRRVTFDNARLFWHYAVAQTLAGVALVQLFPRLAA
jgi:hypothetical protein